MNLSIKNIALFTAPVSRGESFHTGTYNNKNQNIYFIIMDFLEGIHFQEQMEIVKQYYWNSISMMVENFMVVFISLDMHAYYVVLHPVNKDVNELRIVRVCSSIGNIDFNN